MAAWVPTTPPPQNRDLAFFNTGDTPQQDTTTTLRPLEETRPLLNAHTSGDLAHGTQKGEHTIVLLNGLVGETFHLPFDHFLGQHFICGEVQVGVENLPLFHQGVLVRLRFLDLDNHVAGVPDLFGGVAEDRPRPFVFVVFKSGVDTAGFLHSDRVTRSDIRLGTARGEADAVFVTLYLFY